MVEVEDVSNAISEYRPSLKANTVKQYERQLMKLQKDFKSNNFDFLNDVEKVQDHLKTNHYTTQRNVYNSVIMLLLALNANNEYDDLIKKYQEIRDKLNEKYVEDQQSNKISEKQKNNFVSLDELKEMLKTMEKVIKSDGITKKNQISVQDKELLMVNLIYNMLIEVPTRNDMADMKLITNTMFNKIDKDKGNYIVKGKNMMTMVLNDYKTNGKYGEKKIELSKDLQKKINRYVKLIKVKNGEALFTSSTGRPYTRNEISQILLKNSKKYLDGKSIGSTMVRKIVVSDKFGPDSELSKLKSEQAELADKMGHSVSTQEMVYSKK